jgi:hypothetical protein
MERGRKIILGVLLTALTVCGGALFASCSFGSTSSSIISVEDKYTEGLEFTLNEDGTEYSVTGYTGDSTQVVIPAEYNGLPVTSIGYRAFENSVA